MKIKLSKYEVELKDELGWYDNQEIQAILASGAKMNNQGLTGFDGESMLKSTIKAMEVSIVSIKEGDKEIKFSDEWVKGLSQSDGEKLKSAIDTIGKKK